MKRLTRLAGIIILAAAGGLLMRQSTVLAQKAQPAAIPAPQAVGVDNESCLACHGEPDQEITLPSGEVFYLTVERDIYYDSVHGKAGYACVQCHTDIREYPHPELTAQSLREITLDLYPSCARCHQDKYDATADSVHSQALTEGNPDAAVCTDCHGAHNTVTPGEPRTHIPETCERCHSQIYAQYAESVHGGALIGEGNPDVPTCTDCHGSHSVEGPSTSPFRLHSPEICARCHTDPELMGKYNLSTNVLTTFVSDFHGTTVLFEARAPGQETNKPVCIDCHGVHDIRKTDDPQSTVIKANLVTTCQRCHPDASANFSAAWLSHYEPSPEHSPAVYYVNVFYQYFIPILLGGMALFVATDVGRRIYGRFQEKKHA
ncbi:MAG: cytochrome c3 family protein [Chloroflexi bacterium]|nr:cytochrome c3 family protein [Chloroflexota bacterium]